MKEIRILVVDDHLPFLRSVAAWLATLPGVSHVACAASCHQALSLLDRSVPDLVLTDFHLRGTNGFELTRYVKSKADAACIVIMTLFGSPEFHAKAIRIGADHYIDKKHLFYELPRFLAQRFDIGQPSA
ncbi:MAG: response regulator transcription factor [Pseudomonadota bacterium]